MIRLISLKTLATDDIEDSSLQRRGRPVAHAVFGEAASINCANFIYFEAFHDAVCLGKPAVVPALLDELMKLHLGQVRATLMRDCAADACARRKLLACLPARLWRDADVLLSLCFFLQGLDIYYRDNGICPSEAQYCEMVQHKTAGLFRLGITLLQVSALSCTPHFLPLTLAFSARFLFQSFSEDTRDFIPLCNDLGLYYQVMDDVLNLKSAEMFGHKSFCEDLTEGKFSFPIVHHVLASPGDSRVLSIMRKRTTDVTLKQFAVRCLEETQSFMYALKFSEAVAERIRQRCTSEHCARAVTCAASLTRATGAEFGGNATLLALLQHWQDRMRAACTSELPQPPDS